MDDRKPLWLTDPAGTLSAEIGRCHVTVMRLFPTSDARFIVWGDGEPRAALMSGTHPSMQMAMAAAEKAALQLAARFKSRMLAG